MLPGDGTSEPSPIKPRSRRRVGVSYEDLGPVLRTRDTGRKIGRAPRLGLTLLSFTLVAASVLSAAAALYLHRSSNLSVASSLLPANRAVIFVVEGARPDDFRLGRLPNLNDLANQGVSYGQAWAGQLETATPTSAATLGTGVYPRAHSIVGAQWRDARSGQVDRALTPSRIELGVLDQLMESRGVTPLAMQIKNRSPSARVLSVGGAGCAAADAAGTWMADYVLCPVRRKDVWEPGGVTGHLLPSLPSGTGWEVPVVRGTGLSSAAEGWNLGVQDDWITRYALWAVKQSKPALSIIDFPEIGQLEKWIPAHERTASVDQLMAGIDRDIGLVSAELRRERAFAGTVFVVTSDQALSPVNQTVSASSLTQAIVSAGGQTVYLDSDAAAMIGLQDRLQSQPVAEGIQAAGLPHVDAIYDKIGSGGSWAYEAQYLNPSLPRGFNKALEYLLWTMTSDISPDVVVAYAPRTGTDSQRLGKYSSTSAGGGIQWESQHIPLLIAGHGVLPGASSSYPARLVDIAPTVAALLGLPAAKGDGVVLADSMMNPPENAASHQQTTGRWLTPMVRALEERGR